MDGSVAQAHARLSILAGATASGLRPATEPFDTKKQMRLGRAGYSSLGQADGKVTSGMMLMSSGHSFRHTRYADHIVHILEEQDPKLDDRVHVEALFSNAIDRLGDKLELEWWMDSTDLVLVDRASATGLTLWQGYA